jgi:hypothetical protein
MEKNPFFLLVLTSGKVVEYVLGLAMGPDWEEQEKPDKRTLTMGMILGKCENILTFSFILAGQFTALALVFAGKSIFRAEKAKEQPAYYLGGTVVNFTYSVVFAMGVRWVLGRIR